MKGSAIRPGGGEGLPEVDEQDLGNEDCHYHPGHGRGHESPTFCGCSRLLMVLMRPSMTASPPPSGCVASPAVRYFAAQGIGPGLDHASLHRRRQVAQKLRAVGGKQPEEDRPENDERLGGMNQVEEVASRSRESPRTAPMNPAIPKTRRTESRRSNFSFSSFMGIKFAYLVYLRK